MVLTYCIKLEVEVCKPATRFKRSFNELGNSAGVTGASLSITKHGESVPVDRLSLPVDSNRASVNECSGLP